MRHFRWVSASHIPDAYDLRRGGWNLVSHADDSRCPHLAPIKAIDAAVWIVLLGVRGPQIRQRMIVLGVEDRDERARLLAMGFGDVMGPSPGLAELAARALRVADRSQTLPRFRDIGVLRLDLLLREGLVEDKPLGLHPREFELLWRLADSAGVPVSKSRLLTDVWNMGFVPDTNSLAVHIYRLRTKLALAGLDGLVQTAPSGGYVLVPDGGRTILRGKGRGAARASGQSGALAHAEGGAPARLGAG